MLRASTGSVIKNVQLVSLVACSDSPMAGGRIWQLSVQAGYEPLAATSQDILRQSAAMSRKAIAARWIGYGTLTVSMLMGSGVIAASAKPIVATLASHQIADAIAADFANRAPKPDAVLAKLLDPAKQYPAGCTDLVMVARFRKQAQYRAATLPYPAK